MAQAITVKKLTSFASGSVPGLIRLGNFLRRILTFSPADDLIFPQKGISVSIAKGSISVAHGTRFLSGITVKGAKTYPLEESNRYPLPDSWPAGQYPLRTDWKPEQAAAKKEVADNA